MKYFVCLFLVELLYQLSSAQNCTGVDSNANYTVQDTKNETCVMWPIPENCIVVKKCHIGFTSQTHGTNLTCAPGYNSSEESEWNPEDIICTECKNPSYGINCSESVKQCSSVCPYNTKMGCVRNHDVSEDFACDLDDLELVVKSKYFAGIVGVNTLLTIEAYVNIIEADVEMKARFQEKSLNLTKTNDTTYRLDIAVKAEAQGEYIIMATTESSQRNQSVTVKITDPVKNMTVYGSTKKDVKQPTIEVTEDEAESINWTCEAEGTPTPEVIWYYAGVEVGNFPLGDKLYQLNNGAEDKMSSTLFIHPDTPPEVSDSGTYVCQARNGDGFNKTFVETIALELRVLKESPTKAPTYAERVDFLIAVILLGVLLFITIIGFSVIAVHLRKKNGDFKKSNPRPQQKKYEHEDTHDSEPKFTNISPPIEMAPPTTYKHQRPKASLPKQSQMNNTNPPDPGPRKPTQFKPTTNHRPTDVSHYPETRGYTAARSNPGYRRDGEAYDQSEDLYEDTMPEPLPPRNPQRTSPEQPLYDDPAAEDNGLYETTLSFGANGH